MTKTKSQLRAEAVERLRKLNCMDVDCYQLLEATVDDAGEKVGYRVEISKLIDLLTDEEPRKFGVTVEQMAKASTDFFDKFPSINGKKADSLQDSRENLGSNLGSGSEVGSEVDSREKLEADVRTHMFPWRVDMALDWLDRQESITERHWMEICGANANANVELKRQIDVLEANNAQLHTLIAELKADNDYLRDINKKLDYEVREWKGEAKTQRNNFEQATEARKHWQRKYELAKADRDELKSKADALEADKASWQSGYHIDRLAKLQAQRDRYRDLLSKAVDEAQGIVKLMEVDS